MSKNCARCNKIVYAIEELKCLEKIWHKTCFKCTECNMVLNMKTYKGFNKSPYCEAHIPKAKATTIAETPELKRIAENTKIQSNVKYHADFEKTKGKLTQVADDPETLRIRQNTKNISNASYHGEYLKKEKMEKQRELADVVGDNKDFNESEYFSETLAAENISDYRPRRYDNYYEEERPEPTKKSPVDNPIIAPPPQQHHQQPNNIQQHQQQMPVHKQAPTYRHDITGNNSSANNNMREIAYQQQQQQLQLQQQQQQQQLQLQRQQQLLYQQQQMQLQQQQMLDNRTKSAQFIRNEGTNNYMDHNLNHRNNHQQLQNDNYAEMLQHQYMEQAKMLSQSQNFQPNHTNTAIHHQQQQQQQQHAPKPAKMRVYRAMYDYEAQDSDEVSFYENDLIIEMNEIDSGWLTGRVERTGKVGLVPANYLEMQNI